MAPKPKKGSLTDDNEEHDAFALRLIELLNDEQVLAKFKTVLFPAALSKKIDELHGVIERLSNKLDLKDAQIRGLEERICVLEDSNDAIEQYSRRRNLRFHGIPEIGTAENTDEVVLAIVNGKMGMIPPLERHHLERSHRLGRREDGQGRPVVRPIIVRFQSERLRDDVYRTRTRLKAHNQQRRDAQIFINDDLTARRSKMAYDARQLKKTKKIADCWTSFGKVVIKDLANKVKEIRSPNDLKQF